MGKQWKTAGKLEQAGKKGALFTRLSREIQVAVRLGGAHPESNHRLQLALSTARAHSVPKSTIERAIAKGSGQNTGEIIEELIYEGYGPYGVAIVLRCLTDNRTRTVSEIRHLFKIHGGQMGDSGSVLWMFDKMALVKAIWPTDLPDKIKSMSDHAEETALEIGADDLVQKDNVFLFYGKTEDLKNIQKTLEQRMWTVFKAELAYRAKNFLLLKKEEEKQINELLNLFEENPDCQSVYTNLQLRSVNE